MSLDSLLGLADRALSEGNDDVAIDYYQKGIALLDKEDHPSLVLELSLHTNLGTALSSQGRNEEAVESYRKALTAYHRGIDDIVEQSFRKEATGIVAQASFFLGMVYQDMGNHANSAVEAYRYANQLDPMHWASMANLGAVMHDQLSNHAAALQAYNQAYQILTNEERPTDPPEEPRPILSQLQYRIGLCISHDLSRSCAVQGRESEPADCRQLATHAFALAVEFDSSNEAAKHMLASITADATVKRASNSYVKSLFDDYAQDFEHSLVHELHYNGYERLRRGFDRALSKLQSSKGIAISRPPFETVLDAGCGTGLVGEQFRNISQRLIGVDLSQAIVDQAVQKRPGLYDEVLVGDMTELFRARKPVSLIVAGDSYIYFGDLDPLVAAMKDSLGAGGLAAFTLENVDKETEAMLAETSPLWRWQLTASGRFAHRKEYVLSVLVGHHLQLIHYEPLDDFRFEKGVGVRGHIFVIQNAETRFKDQEL